ncbi:terminase small subunit [Lonepinella sp. BR2904]|uniref:terminase small subunit-like protein n=1 Tax=Lonepinella sp. BR2904 TaxID=3434551 RepID=UPI003F6E0083
MPKKDGVKSTSKRGKAQVKEVKKSVGRPSSFVKEVADDICMLLSQGESLRKICDRPSMPNARTVHRWILENDEFCQQYAHAREMQAETLLEEILEISDCASVEDVQVAKLRVDARKWYITKVAPKKYGDRVTQEHSGVDGRPIQIEQKNKVDFSGLNINELEQLERLLSRTSTE